MEQVDWGVRVRVGSHGVPMAPQRLLYLCSESSAVNWFVNFGHPWDGFAAGEWYSIFFLLYRCVLCFGCDMLRSTFGSPKVDSIPNTISNHGETGGCLNVERWVCKELKAEI